MARPKRASGIAVAFWLLAAAWLCANLQPPTVRSVFSWIVEGTNFSHQQRLTLEVAKLLGGERPVRMIAKSTSAPKPAPKLPALPETPFKKLEVPLARYVGVAIIPLGLEKYVEAERVVRDRERSAPPHEPPRREAMS